MLPSRDFLLAFLIPGIRKNKALRVLAFTNTLLMFAIGLFAPFYAVFVEHIGGSVALVGISWAAFMIVTGLLMLLFGRWELAVKEQELLIALGHFIRGGVFISYAFMDNIPQLILTQILWGFGTAIATPAYNAVYAEHIEKDIATEEWAEREGFLHIAIGIAALLGGAIIELLGFRIMFLAIAVVCITTGIYLWRLPRELL